MIVTSVDVIFFLDRHHEKQLGCTVMLCSVFCWLSLKALKPH